MNPFSRTVMLLTIACLAACGPAVRYPANEDAQAWESDAPFDPNAIEDTHQLPPVPPPMDANHYRIGVGDELEIKFYFAPDLNATQQVRPDGRISLMFASDVKAAGLTPPQLAKRIRQTLRKTVKQPELVVVVRNAASQKVFVSGEVLRAGAIALQGRETLLQVLSMAGGMSPTARMDEIALVRTDRGGKQRVYALDLTKAMSGEDTAQNVVLQAGDVVLVPPSDATSFDRWVDQHIRLATPIQGNFVITNQVHNGSY